MGRKSLITVDLGYGDSGKGATVDALVRKHNAGIVVRFNGGAQAGHNVVDPYGKRHTFRQFGSGSFIPGVKTLLSRFMLVDPLALSVEAGKLNIEHGVSPLLSRMYIDERAIVVTPYHKALNRLREFARGEGRHGSCGMGIGETVQLDEELPGLTIHVGDFLDREKLVFKLVRLYNIISQRIDALNIRHPTDLASRDFAVMSTPVLNLAVFFEQFAKDINIATPDNVAELLQSRTSVFEAAQGVLLDQDFGFHPYTTWSKTTSANARTILKEAGVDHPITEIGILRTFPTRHGPGPFVTENNTLRDYLPNECNTFNEWQREFRTGWLDLPMLRYALTVNGPIDYLAVTHVDCLNARSSWTICRNYDSDILSRIPKSLTEQAELTAKLAEAKFTPDEIGKECVLDTIRTELGIPIGLVSHGPTSNDRVFTDEAALVSA